MYKSLLTATAFAATFIGGMAAGFRMQDDMPTFDNIRAKANK